MGYHWGYEMNPSKVRILQPHSSIFQLRSAASAQESALWASTRPAPNKVRQSPRFHPVNHGPTLALTAGLPHRKQRQPGDEYGANQITGNDGNAQKIDRNHEHQPAKLSNDDSGATTSAGRFMVPQKSSDLRAHPHRPQVHAEFDQSQSAWQRLLHGDPQTWVYHPVWELPNG